MTDNISRDNISRERDVKRKKNLKADHMAFVGSTFFVAGEWGK